MSVIATKMADQKKAADQKKVIGQKKENEEKIELDQILFEEFFIEANLNKDGFLTYEELYKILRKKKYNGAKHTIQKMFGETNVSGSGKISFEEFMAAMGFENVKEPTKKPEPIKQETMKKVESKPVSAAAKPPEKKAQPQTKKVQDEDDDDPRRPALRKVFKTFDKDGNGLIDKKELRSVLMSLGKYFTEKEIDNMVKNADKDGTDTLDYEEFISTVFGVQSKKK